MAEPALACEVSGQRDEARRRTLSCCANSSSAVGLKNLDANGRLIFMLSTNQLRVTRPNERGREEAILDAQHLRVEGHLLGPLEA